jgi:hypothetical protein
MKDAGSLMITEVNEKNSVCAIFIVDASLNLFSCHGISNFSENSFRLDSKMLETVFPGNSEEALESITVVLSRVKKERIELEVLVDSVDENYCNQIRVTPLSSLKR